jgi:hypothetical protein
MVVEKLSSSAMMAAKWNAHRLVEAKPLGKYPLGILRRRWKENIKLDLSKSDCEEHRMLELIQDCVQWRTLLLMVSNLLWVLLPQLASIRKKSQLSATSIMPNRRLSFEISLTHL